MLEARKVDIAGRAYRLVGKVTFHSILAVARTHGWGSLIAESGLFVQKHCGLVAPQLLSEIM